MLRTITVLVVSGTIFAQSAPPGCPANRPVDDIMAQIRKERSKTKHRNGDPSPAIHCRWGWCIDVSKTPPNFPGDPAPDTNSNAGSSENGAIQTCGEAMQMALGAAHNLEVGDYYFREKNYKGSLQRYQEALKEKPNDEAIHVRLGRAFEKLNRIPQAIEEYKAAQKLSSADRWSEEAKSALERLQHSPVS